MPTRLHICLVRFPDCLTKSFGICRWIGKAWLVASHPPQFDQRSKAVVQDMSLQDNTIAAWYTAYHIKSFLWLWIVFGGYNFVTESKVVTNRFLFLFRLMIVDYQPTNGPDKWVRIQWIACSHGSVEDQIENDSCN